MKRVKPDFNKKPGPNVIKGSTREETHIADLTQQIEPTVYTMKENGRVSPPEDKEVASKKRDKQMVCPKCRKEFAGKSIFGEQVFCNECE